MIDCNQLPRVTYFNTGADFTGIHELFNSELPRFEAEMLGRTHPNLIDGRDDQGGELYGVRSPIDHNITLGRLHEGGPDAIDRAVRAASRAFQDWRRTTMRDRVVALRRVANELRQRRFEIGMALLLEVGKSRLEAMGETEEAIDMIEHYCDLCASGEGLSTAMKVTSNQERGEDILRPYGVFAVISPFNFPLALAVGMTSAALLAGNTVVWKPTDTAALTAPLYAAAIRAAGLPDGVFNMVCGTRVAGQALVDHPDVAGIAFTGSHDVGMSLLQKVARGPYAKPVLAELGGKNPAFVTASADLDIAVGGVGRAAFGLSGQKCSACSVVFVDKSVESAFVDGLVAFTRTLVLDDPRRGDQVFMGPVINATAGQRFDDAAKIARQEGQILTGGDRLQGDRFERGSFCTPTIVNGVAADSRLLRQEFFVPLLVIRAVDNLQDAITEANRSTFGLTAGLYTKSESELETFLDGIEAGVLYANRPSSATTGAWPGYQGFVGWKGSGTTGRGGLGPHYVQQFMREQSRTVSTL